jgi:hypothetical protein
MLKSRVETVLSGTVSALAKKDRLARLDLKVIKVQPASPVFLVPKVCKVPKATRERPDLLDPVAQKATSA